MSRPIIDPDEINIHVGVQDVDGNTAQQHIGTFLVRKGSGVGPTRAEIGEMLQHVGEQLAQVPEHIGIPVYVVRLDR